MGLGGVSPDDRSGEDGLCSICGGASNLNGIGSGDDAVGFVRAGPAAKLPWAVDVVP
jgi:hypothetical protein